MRKIFIDCGGHTGSSVRHFCKTRQDWQDYEIFSFEPDPQHYHKWPVNIPICEINGVQIGFKKFDVIKKAVWIEDCSKDFYITEADFRPEGGSTLNITKHAHNYEKYRSKSGYKFPEIKVNCVDIHDFIISNFNAKDYIIMKLDVEGAEYDVIPHMLRNGTFDYLDEFYIEWHNWRAGRCPRPYNVHRYKSEEDISFEKEIMNDFQLECKFWDAIDC